MLIHWRSRLRAHLRRFARDNRGVTAVEFALILPLMVILYFGTTELTQAYLAKRRADHVSAALGDLTSQVPTISASNVTDVFRAASLLMAPYAADTSVLGMKISSVTSDATTGVWSVQWDMTNGVNATNGFRTLAQIKSDLTAATLNPGDGIIVAEARYSYKSPTTYFINPNGVTFSNVFYVRPRRSPTVVCADCPKQ